MDDNDVCPICLDCIMEGESLVMPGCKHKLHVQCALDAVQYDGRCPVCRNTVVQTRRTPMAPDIFTQFEQELAERERMVRRYQNRRSRLIRSRNSLKKMREKLKIERRSCHAAERDLERAWNLMQRQLWMTNNEIHALKMRRRKHQRRVSDLSRRLRQRLDPVIGPPPESDQ